MEKEDVIIEMLGKVMSKQDEHSVILNEHTQTLDQHTQILDQHTQTLKGHSIILNEHGKILRDHGHVLDNHSSQFKEHGQILSALRSGQDYLKAEFDGLKLTNAKEFGELKEQINTVSINQELLRNETWTNKVDIQRIKKTMGMA